MASIRDMASESAAKPQYSLPEAAGITGFRVAQGCGGAAFCCSADCCMVLLVVQPPKSEPTTAGC
jgi:hypothetical protein